MDQKSSARLLVCTIPQVLETAHSSLGEYYDCTFCLTVTEACSNLHYKPQAILCNLHFDNGRLFDFLSYVRAHPYGRTVPFLVSQWYETLTPSMIKGIETASRTIGIEAFIEVYRWRQEYGAEGADERIRATIDEILNHQKAARQG